MDHEPASEDEHHGPGKGADAECEQPSSEGCQTISSCGIGLDHRFTISDAVNPSLQLHHGPDAPPILEVSQAFQIEGQQAFDDPDAVPVRKLVVVVHDDVPDVLASQ